MATLGADNLVFVGVCFVEGSCNRRQQHRALCGLSSKTVHPPKANLELLARRLTHEHLKCVNGAGCGWSHSCLEGLCLKGEAARDYERTAFAIPTNT